MSRDSSIRAMRARLAVSQFGTVGIPLSIALVTFVIFSPALWNGLVWDDEVNLVNNPHYRGLGWPQLRWMFTSVLMRHWIPLTWVTFGLDYLLWGMNPVGYHLTNLLLHSANAAVFSLVALRLLRRATPGLGEIPLRLGAAAAALFFALHPLRAESVAWVTERRDVLSGLFFFLTLLTYLQACEAEGTRRRRWLVGSVGCYALALASKSIVMTLPFILILLDIYPLRRLGGERREWRTPGARRIWAEKIPYLLLAMAGAGTALYVVAPDLTLLEKYPLSARVAMALYGFWFYVWKTLLPLGLVPLYELPPQVNLLDSRFLLSAIAVGILTGGFILLRRKWPAGLAVWVAYGVILAPVSGLVHAGYQLAHDRYSYLSCLGWALLVGAGVCAGFRAAANGSLRPSLARVSAGAAAVWLIGLAALTWHQVRVWRDTETLWTYAVEIDPTCSICHGNLGLALANQGRVDPAIAHLEKALALHPDRWRIHGALGVALARVGRLSEAVTHFQSLVERSPNDVNFVNDLGVALVEQGKLEEGIERLRQAIRLDPSHVGAHLNLGLALTSVGKPTEAIDLFRRAVELAPKSLQPRFALARAYLVLGDTRSAQEEYESLKRVNPGLASQLAPLLKR